MFDLIPALLKFVPGIADLIGAGKVVEVATIGAQIATEVLGTTDPKEVESRLSTDPALAEQFKARLEAETERLRLQLADVQDARRTQVTLAQAGSALAWAPVILAYMVVIGFMGLTGLMVFKAVPETATATMLFGTLSTAFGMVLNYFFGSSRGSAEKAGSIDKILDGLKSNVRSLTR